MRRVPCELEGDAARYSQLVFATVKHKEIAS